MTDQPAAPAGPPRDLPGLFKAADEALKRSEAARAETLYRLFLARANPVDDAHPVALAKGRLAQINGMRGEYLAAEPLFREAIDLLHRLGQRADEAITRYNLAAMLVQIERVPEAVELMEQVVQIDEEISHPDLHSDRATLESYRARLGGDGPPGEPAFSLNPTPPPQDDLLNLIVTFVNTENWDAARAFVEANMRLLDPAVDHQFEGLIGAAQAQGNLEMAHHLQIHRSLISIAQSEGIEAAFQTMMAGPDEAVIAALKGFVNAEDWDASRKVLERNPLLLSSQAETTLQGYIQAALAEGQEDLAYHLSIHLDVLQSAKEVGYDEAFRRIDTPPDEDIARQIAEMLNQPDMAARQTYLTAHPDLISPEADNTFEALVQAALAIGENNRATQITALRDIVRAARATSVEEAFSRAVPVPSDAADEEPVDSMVVVSVVAHNTIAVMTQRPDQRDDWLTNLQALRDEARGLGDVQMVALLDGIERLLNGDNPKFIDVAALTAEYRAAWDQIVAAL